MKAIRHPKLLLAIVRKRPWPLPHGWKYCDKGYQAWWITNGYFVKVSHGNLLMAVSLFGCHRFVTKDQLIEVKCKNKRLEPDWDKPAINLAKPV